jgi:hypothetical protein
LVALVNNTVTILVNHGFGVGGIFTKVFDDIESAHWLAFYQVTVTALAT